MARSSTHTGLAATAGKEVSDTVGRMKRLELTATELVGRESLLPLDATGRPEVPLVAVDLDSLDDAADAGLVDAMASKLESPHIPVIGHARWPLSLLAEQAARAIDLTLVQAEPGRTGLADRSEACVAVADIDAELDRLEQAVSDRPLTATTLCQTVRLTESLSATDGLVAESLAYSMLLASPEFQVWREATPRKPVRPVENPVRLDRTDNHLTITLNHPARRNAYSQPMRDGLVEALEVLAWDTSIQSADLRGEGPAFCSGGDLDEFGTIDNVTAAHLIRLRQGAGAALHAVRDRVTAHLHGPCIGAGIEVPAFADRVAAAPGTTFRLPELAMGLIPGAGGTVSIPARIGRWRTVHLALSGTAIGTDAALEWGLIDQIE